MTYTYKAIRACSNCGTFYAVPGSTKCAACIDSADDVQERK